MTQQHSINCYHNCSPLYMIPTIHITGRTTNQTVRILHVSVLILPIILLIQTNLMLIMKWIHPLILRTTMALPSAPKYKEFASTIWLCKSYWVKLLHTFLFLQKLGSVPKSLMRTYPLLDITYLYVMRKTKGGGLLIYVKSYFFVHLSNSSSFSQVFDYIAPAICHCHWHLLTLT